MSILSFFDEEANCFPTLCCRDVDIDKFLTELGSVFLDCYIDPALLARRIEEFGNTRNQELDEILPSLGNIKSGDFGEILCYFVYLEKYEAQGANGPMKWRWKENKNKPAPYSDVIFFTYKDGAAPAEKDLLITIESKMKAVQGAGRHPINKAVDGAHKDYVTRMATSLDWLRRQYKQSIGLPGTDADALREQVRILERYIKSDAKGEYTRKVHAVAIVDQEFLGEELAKEITLDEAERQHIQIAVISISQLKDRYEAVFKMLLDA